MADKREDERTVAQAAAASGGPIPQGTADALSVSPIPSDLARLAELLGVAPERFGQLTDAELASVTALSGRLSEARADEARERQAAKKAAARAAWFDSIRPNLQKLGEGLLPSMVAAGCQAISLTVERPTEGPPTLRVAASFQQQAARAAKKQAAVQAVEGASERPKGRSFKGMLEFYALHRSPEEQAADLEEAAAYDAEHHAKGGVGSATYRIRTREAAKLGFWKPN